MAYTPVSAPHIAVVLSAGTGSKSIFGAQPVYLNRVIVNAALVGTLTITGLKDDAGTAANYVVPVGYVGVLDFADSYCAALSVQKSSASDDGKIVLFYSQI
jgi:hypothetical protein